MKVFVAILHDRGELSDVLGAFASEADARARVETERPGLVWRPRDKYEGGGLSGYLDPEDEYDGRNMRAQVLPFDVEDDHASYGDDP